ncbi:MAG: GNAT family N-acetyltransferase [Gemmatimonadota bacterium]
MSASFRIVSYETPSDFLDRCRPWLKREEARYNLVLSLAEARAAAAEWEDGACFIAVEEDGDVIGCAMRTPPHKLLVTDMPVPAARLLTESVLDRYDEIPAVLGPPSIGQAVAEAWVLRRGGGWRVGMGQGVYRLDRVTDPKPMPKGSMRVAVQQDFELAIAWGEGFARDTGIAFPTGEDTVRRWIDTGRLHVWEVAGEVVSIAVAQGFTGDGVRIGYVYTPPEARRRGYASALVARLSRKELEAGRDFCMLYTDLGNPTSNAIYQRLGYRLIDEVVDILIDGEDRA